MVTLTAKVVAEQTTSGLTRMPLNEEFYCQLPVNCTDVPSLSWMEPSTWNPGIDVAFPFEGEHETFTSPPGGTLLDLGEKTPGNPLMVQPVASTLPPEFASDTTHVPVSELQAT